jgi:hypothetical protein
MQTVFARARRRAMAAVPATAADNFGDCFIVPGMTAKDRDVLVELLDQVARHDQTQVDSLERRLVSLAQAEVAAYAGLDRVKYCLHAVLVHDGEPSSGHYWTFIRNGDPSSARDRWLKFNDLVVTAVAESEMLALSLGGSGYASAYCLMYALRNWGDDPPAPLSPSAGDAMEVDSQTPPPPSRTSSIVREGRLLLPRVRIEEVDADNAAFDREVAQFEAAREVRDREQLARSIVETATAALRESTTSLRGLMSPEVREAVGGCDAVPGRSCGARSLVEFCLSSGSPLGALTHALCKAWHVFMCAADDDERDLLQYLSSRAHEMSAFPPLSSAPTAPAGRAPDGPAETPASLLVKEIGRLLLRFPGDFPADVQLLPRESLQRVVEALSGAQQLHHVQENAVELRVYHGFALRAMCLLRAAMRAALNARWSESLGLFVAVMRQDAQLYAAGCSDASARARATAFVSDPKMSLARRDEEAIRFLPSILKAAAAHESGGTSAAATPATAVAESRSMHVHDLITVLTDRAQRKRTAASMLGGSSPSVSEELPLEVARKCAASLTGTVRSQGTAALVHEQVRAAAQSAMREADTVSHDACAKRYEEVRDELCSLSCDASDTQGVMDASRRLIHRSSARTAAA